MKFGNTIHALLHTNAAVLLMQCLIIPLKREIILLHPANRFEPEVWSTIYTEIKPKRLLYEMFLKFGGSIHVLVHTNAAVLLKESLIIPLKRESASLHSANRFEPEDLVNRFIPKLSQNGYYTKYF